MNSALEEIRDIRLWIETGEMNLEEIEVQTDWFIENGQAITNKIIDDHEPEEAPAAFTLLKAFFSASAVQKPSLVMKLSSAVQTFKVTAEKLGKKLKADAVSIAVGFPWSVSIDLVWDI